MSWPRNGRDHQRDGVRKFPGEASGLPVTEGPLPGGRGDKLGGVAADHAGDADDGAERQVFPGADAVALQSVLEGLVAAEADDVRVEGAAGVAPGKEALLPQRHTSLKNG